MGGLPSLFPIDPQDSSSLVLICLAVAAAAAAVLFKLGVIRWALRQVGALVRSGIRIGFELWKRLLSWADWPRFYILIAGLLAVGLAGGLQLAFVAVLCGAALLFIGVTTCLAYMFIDLERYEVGRGYKAVHNPLKGQELATNLIRYGHLLGAPMLAGAAVGAIGGFAMLNQGLYHTIGQDWYTTGADKQPTYIDFLAYPLVHLLRIVDLIDLASSQHFLTATYVRPEHWPAKALLAAFKAFFTLVLLQQLFASMRRGKLLSETIAEFWSPHEPIAERARLSLPQHGVGAVRPLLLSLRSIEFLTKEQRGQIPRVLADIGPAALPILTRHLHDVHENVRAIAAGAVGCLHALDAAPELVKLRHDPSDWVRESMVEALGKIGGASAGVVRRKQFLRRALSVPSRLIGWVIWRRGAAQPRNAAESIALAVSTLRAALSDPATAVRREAARALGLIGPAAEAAPDLIALLNDEDEAVRCQATESLGRVDGPPETVIAALVGLLPDVSPAVRAAAARTLGSLKGKAESAVPALVPLLQDREEAVRQAAAEAVGRIGTLNGDSTHTLVEGLANPDNVVRADTAEALGTIGETAGEATPALVEALKDTNDRVRGKAAEALGKIGEAAAEAVPSLVRALHDKDNWVSAMAAEALGEMGESADGAIPALMRSLGHINPQVRSNAAEALGKMGDAAASAAPALEKAAGDEDAEVRSQAVRALGAVVPIAMEDRILMAATADADPSVRAAAVEALGKRGETDEEVVGALLRALSDPADSVKVEATKALPRLTTATEPTITGLCALLDDDNAWVQLHAALALSRFGPSAATAGAALLRAAQTAELDVREQAMRALVMIQPPEIVTALAAGLKDASGEIRKVASAGLMKGAAIPPEVVPDLVVALRDPEVQVRANAAHALARLDALPAEAVDALIECTADPRDDLRMNSALALSKAPAARAGETLAHLIEDPNPRIRLIAARFALLQDPADAGAGAAVTSALADSTTKIRKAAIDLIESLGSNGAAWRDALKQQMVQEEDSGLREMLGGLIERLEDDARDKASSDSATPDAVAKVLAPTSP
jgi:HEAT repeat protein